MFSRSLPKCSTSKLWNHYAAAMLCLHLRVLTIYTNWFGPNKRLNSSSKTRSQNCMPTPVCFQPLCTENCFMKHYFHRKLLLNSQIYFQPWQQLWEAFHFSSHLRLAQASLLCLHILEHLNTWSVTLLLRMNGLHNRILLFSSPLFNHCSK